MDELTVVLDPGHGADDTGAVNKYITEKEINLKVAYACKSYLEQFNQINVKMTRYQDTAVSLESRCDISNLSQANLFLSIHHNAGGGDGFEVYHYTGSVQGERFSKLIAEEFESIGQNKRYVGSGLYAGTKKGDYFVLANTHCPSALGEFGFMDTKDYTQFDEDSELIRIGKAYAKAILKYFDIEEISHNLEIEKEETKIQYATKEEVDDLRKTMKRFEEVLKSNNLRLKNRV